MKQLRCALYPRVSTEEQFIHGLSLPAQLQDLTDYANRMGYKIVGVYADEGVSARKPVSKRPALLNLLRDVQEDKIDIILVTKLDRWFRNIKEYQTTQEILEKHNCYWKTIFEDYDTSTANGQMVVNIMLAVAQNECDRTSERIKVVLEHKVRNGEHVTGAAPYGYITVNKKLQKDPEREHIVNDIFDYYFRTFSKRKTVFYILDKYDDPKLTKYKINRILQSEAYCGMYQGMSGYYPAYISEKQFEQIRSTSAAKTYDFTNGAYLFSGIIKCPVCGNNMTGFIKKQKLKDGTRSLYRRYRCSAKFSDHASGACITEHVIEEYLLENLMPELENRIVQAKQKASAPYKDKTPEIRAEMNRLNILFQKGRITDEYYDKQYEMLERKLQAEKSHADVQEISAYLNIRKSLSGNWIDVYKSLDLEHQKTFWKRLLKEITIDKETHKISGFSFLI